MIDRRILPHGRPLKSFLRSLADVLERWEERGDDRTPVGYRLYRVGRVGLLVMWGGRRR